MYKTKILGSQLTSAFILLNLQRVIQTAHVNLDNQKIDYPDKVINLGQEDAIAAANSQNAYPNQQKTSFYVQNNKQDFNIGYEEVRPEVWQFVRESMFDDKLPRSNAPPSILKPNPSSNKVSSSLHQFKTDKKIKNPAVNPQGMNPWVYQTTIENIDPIPQWHDIVSQPPPPLPGYEYGTSRYRNYDSYVQKPSNKKNPAVNPQGMNPWVYQTTIENIDPLPQWHDIVSETPPPLPGYEYGTKRYRNYDSYIQKPNQNKKKNPAVNPQGMNPWVYQTTIENIDPLPQWHDIVSETPPPLPGYEYGTKRYRNYDSYIQKPNQNKKKNPAVNPQGMNPWVYQTTIENIDPLPQWHDIVSETPPPLPGYEYGTSRYRVYN